jgi:3'-5' exoribonuclease
MFREALLLHYLDDLDSKMAAIRSALDSNDGEGNWTAFNGALARRILRTDKFWGSQAAVIPDATPVSEPVASGADSMDAKK